MNHITKLLDGHNIPYQCNIDLKRKTWIKTGGIASIWITPTTIKDLVLLCQYLYDKELKFEIVGHTSNLFFRSSYNPEIVISTIKLTNYEIEENKVICNCGVKISTLSREMANNGYAGYYGFVDIPGTVAAAVYNNSGWGNVCEMSSIFYSLDLLTPQGEVQTLTFDDLLFKHRASILKQRKKQGVIIQVVLKMDMSVEDEIEKVQKVHKIRNSKMEGTSKNLGSVYRRLQYRKTPRNICINLINKVFKLTMKQRKDILLCLYGYKQLDKYISNKNINTFLWIDTESEHIFDEYNEFMQRVYVNPETEIEIKQE